jgi:Ca-activated chloride channel family protein
MAGHAGQESRTAARQQRQEAERKVAFRPRPAAFLPCVSAFLPCVAAFLPWVAAFLPCVAAFLLCVAALLLSCLPAFAQASPQEPSFHSGSAELVVLPVVVTDKQGRFISDLNRDQFAVFDNGRRVPIEFFTNEDTPVTIGLVVDASGSMRSKIGEVVAATLAFARSSNPDDELFAVRFNDDVQNAVSDAPFLLAGDARRLESAMTAVRPDGRTALYDGIMAALDHLSQGSRARKALIVISDGGDNASSATLDDVLKRARDSNAALYTVGIYDDNDFDRNPRVLKALAHTTGGERYLPRSPGDLLRVCSLIAREIRSGYTIGYAPPDRDGAYHRIRVVLDATPRKLNVRTRPGYFAAGRTSQ